MTWVVVAATASSALFYIAAAGRFVPIGRSPDVTYLFAPPGLTSTVVAITIVHALLSAADVIVGSVGEPASPDAANIRCGEWLMPLCGLGAVLFGTLPALPSVGQRGVVVSYLLYDL